MFISETENKYLVECRRFNESILIEESRSFARIQIEEKSKSEVLQLFSTISNKLPALTNVVQKIILQLEKIGD